MKKVIFLFALTLLVNAEISGQIINDLVIFSNDGDRFTVILNGERRNVNPETNVKISSLNLATYKARVIFENKDYDDIETNIYFHGNGNECVFGIVKKNRRKHYLDYVSSTKLKAFLNNSPQATDNSTSNPDNSYSTGSNTGTNTTNTTTTTTNTNTYPGNSSDHGSISVGNGNLGVGVGSNGGVSIKTKEGSINMGPHNETSAVINVLGNAVNLHKPAEKVGCHSPMLETQFELAKKKIDTAATATDTEKSKAANEIVNSNCLLTSQVQQLLNLFKEDQTKLEFSITAYNHTSDLNNYHKLKDSFSSDAYKKDFQTFVSSHK